MRACLRAGDTGRALASLEDARKLARSIEPPPLSDEQLTELEEMIRTMPPEALQVLRHGLTSPYSALGIDRLARARVLNNANRRQLLKEYRRLAMRLHPDRCEHAMASDAMQVLNAAYDKLVGKAQPQGGATTGAGTRKRPRP